MRISDFDYELPAGGRSPRSRSPERDASRLLRPRPRGRGAPHHHVFRDLPELLAPGRPPGGQPQPRLPRPPAGPPRGRRARPRSCSCATSATTGWEALVRPGRRLRPGRRGRPSTTDLDASSIETAAAGPDGRRVGAPPAADGAVAEAPRARRPRAAAALHPPRPTARRTASATRRSTRARAGSVAAPTAGLHFTPALLDAPARARASRIAEVVLHVGPGHVPPVTVEDVADHRVDARALRRPRGDGGRRRPRARARGGRVVAVGTTAVRALETAARDDGHASRAGAGETDLVIVPGYPLPRGGRPGHELPPAALVAAPAGGRLRRPRARARRLREAAARAATASTATATRC